ncbi:MAG: protein-L-isoaspartate(D-aspartate) O-methyltransferase [Gammaproteobacteria bacterium]|nr:protein-L-isoaspartate(D-aspartate) O-methyltransferase [Gammaproteobacteria bacterium]
MLREVEADARELGSTLGKDGFDARVLSALGRVPRHEFVPARFRSMAYANQALSIGHGQTISQPFIVALMTDLLAVDESSVVLEVGTGSGYQAAVLAELVARVYGIEAIGELAEQARARLQRLGYDNVEIRKGDGYAGWVEHAPFDGIIVTAAAPETPPRLVEQLRPGGGRLVIPVGAPYETQWLTVVEKGEERAVRTRRIIPVAFVPMREVS